MTQKRTLDLPTDDLFHACLEAARNAVSRDASFQADVAETVALAYYQVADEIRDYVRRRRETDEVVVQAVRYMAHVHVNPSWGTGIEQFYRTLYTLIELAVPNTGLDARAAEVLPAIREGIREAEAGLSVDRQLLRLDDEDTDHIEQLQEAACQYGRVFELLQLAKALFHGEELTEYDRNLFRLAAFAAPLATHTRRSQGIDKD